MSDKPVKTAVVGVGLIGEQHAEAYHELRALRAGHGRTISTRSGPKRSPSGSAAPRPPVSTTSPTPMLRSSPSRPRITCTSKPTMRHARGRQARRASRNRWPPSPAKRRTMVEPAPRDKNVKLTLNLGNRWNAELHQSSATASSRAKSASRSSAYSRCSDTIWVPTQMLSWAGKSGPQWFLFAHTMDLLRWFLGQEAHQVYAVGTKRVLKAKGIDCLRRDPGDRPVRHDLRHLRDILDPARGLAGTSSSSS